MNFTIRVRSTMLPLEVSCEFSVDGTGSDEREEFLSTVEQMINDNAPTAEFRCEGVPEFNSDDNDSKEAIWLAAQYTAAKLSPLEVAKLLLLVHENDYNDVAQVMSVVYAKYKDSATAIIDAVDEGDYHVDFADSLEAALVGFGHTYYENDHTEMSLDGNDEYFDWASFGRDTSDGSMQYADGDWYVWKEWN